jgi:hypothetical protein
MAKPADIGADLGQYDLRGGCANSGNVGEINAGNAVKLTSQIEPRIVALPEAVALVRGGMGSSVALGRACIRRAVS